MEGRVARSQLALALHFFCLGVRSDQRVSFLLLLRNSDLNRLVMDYLVIEGYKDAADCFSKESGLKPFVDSDSILNRMIIRGAIQRGDIDDAIGRVNELDPEVSSATAHPILVQ